ncbi:3-isopropylmalate dehydrogenase [Peptoniphilus sp. ING2-D1G]|nr:3-isopropylmalate dehydrogenase [Peptoniphilus sp. ING2-D1G]
MTVLPGDGIGPEIIGQAEKIFNYIAAEEKVSLIVEKADIGGVAIDKYGTPFPEETEEKCLSSDAVLLGAVGGPKWDDINPEIRPEKGLLAMRKSLGTYANLRPAKMRESLIHHSPIKEEIVSGTDIMIVRELTGGIYFGKRERGEKKGIRFAYDVEYYDEKEISRISHIAFKQAHMRKKHLTLVDKANVLDSSKLWREVVSEIAKDYEDVKVDFMYVDNASMQLIKRPTDFDVILTNNIFGDILSDEMSQIIGSIGLLPSISAGEGPWLYEPIHGSAPDIAGKNLANPLGTILSVAELLRNSLKEEKIATKIEEAVEEILEEGYRTSDLTYGEYIGCEEMGDLIVEKLRKSKIF